MKVIRKHRFSFPQRPLGYFFAPWRGCCSLQLYLPSGKGVSPKGAEMLGNMRQKLLEPTQFKIEDYSQPVIAAALSKRPKGTENHILRHESSQLVSSHPIHGVSSASRVFALYLAPNEYDFISSCTEVENKRNALM